MSRINSRYNNKKIFHKNITIYENDNNDSITLNASNIIDGGYTLTFPANDGDTNQILSTNGSGILNWIDQSSGLEENISISGTLSVSGTTTLNSDTTINADLNISDDLNVNGTSTIDGISTFNNDVTINGSLTVNGSSTYVYSENLVIKDPLIKLADLNSTDNLDIGFYGEYNNKYSGLIRNPNDEEWYLFKDSTDDPPNTSNLEQAILNSNLDGGVIIKVIAKTNLTKGHTVYIHSDTDNDNTYVDKAIANDTSKMPSFGLILKDTTANNIGYVITLGNIINVNISDVVESGITLNIGDTCYISASETGKITNIAPSGESNRIQNIGIVIRIQNSKVSLRVGGAGRTNACPSLNHNNIFIGNASNNVSTTSFNDALSNSNAVLTSGDQTIDGTKTFNNTISASITGNAATVTNGIYTTSSVTDLSDISSSGSGQIITSAERTKLTNFNTSDLNGIITNNQLEHSSMTIDGTSVSLGESINTSNTTYTNGSGIILTGTTFSANVDDTSIEHDTNGKISIKNSGVTNDMLAGSISNDKLAGSISNDKLAGSISNDKLVNNSMTINGTSVSLGGSITTPDTNTTYTNGSGITLTGTTFSANVDDTSIEHDTNGKISIKNSGVTNDMLAGSISNDKLAGSISNDKLVNNSMTINGTSVSLGDTINVGDITSVIAGNGLSGGATSGDATLNIDISEFSDITPTNGDKFLTLDSDGITEQLTTVASLATLFAGNGLDASSSVLSVDVSDFMTNGADNRIITATGKDTMNAESKLTFDGSSLSLVTDSSKIKFGANSEITLTHNHDTGLTLTNTISGTNNRPVIFKLKSEEDNIVADNVIGALEFAAGDSSGTDAATNNAGIYAVAENTFTNSANPTKLVFTTGKSEDASIITNASAIGKMTLTSDGDLVVNGHVFGSGSITYHKVLNRSLSIVYLGSTFKEIHSNLRIKIVVNKSVVTLGFYSGAFNANNKFIRYEIFNWSNSSSYTSNKAFMYGGTSRKAINIHHTLTGLTPGNTYYFAWRFRSDSNYAYIYPSNIYSHPEVFVIEHENGSETSHGSLTNHTYPSV